MGPYVPMPVGFLGGFANQPVDMPTNYGGGFAGPTPNSYAGNVGPVGPVAPFRGAGFQGNSFMPVQTDSPVDVLGASAGEPSPSGFQWSNMLNPLFLGGLGMLANSFGGRPYGAPSPWQGFASGAAMGRQFQLDEEERAQRQAEAQAAAAEAQRQAAYQAAVEEQFGPGAGAAAAAGQPLNPFLPTAAPMPKFHQVRDTQTGDDIFVTTEQLLADQERYQVIPKKALIEQRFGADGLETRALTDEQAIQAGIDPEKKGDYIVEKGVVKVAPGSETRIRKEQEIEAVAPAIEDALTAYEQSGAATGSATPLTGAKAKADVDRDAVVAAYANSLVTTPGDAPSDEQVQAAEAAVPYPYDPNFATKMQRIRERFSGTTGGRVSAGSSQMDYSAEAQRILEAEGY